MACVKLGGKSPIEVQAGNIVGADDKLTRRSFMNAAVCVCCTCAPLIRAIAAASNATVADLGAEGLPNLLELGADRMTRIGQTVWVKEIAPQIWLHTTTARIPGDYIFPANGLVIERPTGSLMIDTGYLPEQSETLLQWSKTSLSAPITSALATHFHNDRTGGIAGLRKHGVRTLAYPLTCKLALEHKSPVPEPIKDFRANRFRLDDSCELFFPGAGHTRDNVVVWIPRKRVLFGGCLLKSISSGGLGNIDDAVVAEWADSVRGVQAKYPNPLITIPGHGTIAGDPASWTLMLLAKNQDSR
jgi:metallo-beta-lactamase class B